MELKKIWFNGHNWYIDYKLKEIRNIDNPHKSISFDDLLIWVTDMKNLLSALFKIKN